MTATRMPGAQVLGPRESQPPKPGEPDMAPLYLGSLFETLDYTLVHLKQRRNVMLPVIGIGSNMTPSRS